MTNDDAYHGQSLEEEAREANSNLQRLIEAVGGRLAASGDLLARLQHILSGGAQLATAEASNRDESGPPADRCDC